MRRAARLGDGYTGLSDRQSYELDACGKILRSLVVSEDPERTFARLAPHVMYWANSYASWFENSDTRSFDAINDDIASKIRIAEGVRTCASHRLHR